jgi:hypothetical protein
VLSANPAAALASTNPDSTSVSNSASSSGLAGARASRRSRTTATLNPSLLAFSPAATTPTRSTSAQKS